MNKERKVDLHIQNFGKWHNSIDAICLPYGPYIDHLLWREKFWNCFVEVAPNLAQSTLSRKEMIEGKIWSDFQLRTRCAFNMFDFSAVWINARRERVLCENGIKRKRIFGWHLMTLICLGFCKLKTGKTRKNSKCIPP